MWPYKEIGYDLKRFKQSWITENKYLSLMMNWINLPVAREIRLKNPFTDGNSYDCFSWYWTSSRNARLAAKQGRKFVLNIIIFCFPSLLLKNRNIFTQQARNLLAKWMVNILSFDSAASLRVKLKSKTRKLKQKKENMNKRHSRHRTRDADHLGFVCGVKELIPLCLGRTLRFVFDGGTEDRRSQAEINFLYDKISLNRSKLWQWSLKIICQLVCTVAFV